MIAKIHNIAISKIILFSIAIFFFAVNGVFAVGTWTYDESDNKIVVTAGTSGTPATFADFVTADRADTAELTPEDTPVACTTNITLTYQIRPVEDLALQITFTLAGTSAGAGDTLDVTGTLWDGSAQTDNIDVSGGDAAYNGSYKWRTITDIDCTGWADGTLKVTQQCWGVIWDYGNGAYTVSAILEIGNGSTTTHFTDTKKYITFVNTGIANGGYYIKTKANATFTLGALHDAATKETEQGCHLHFADVQSYLWAVHDDAGLSYFYNSSFTYDGDNGLFEVKAGSRIWNCTFGQGLPIIYCDVDMYNSINSYANFGLQKSSGTFDRIVVYNVGAALRLGLATGGTFSNILAYCTQGFDVGSITANVYVIDSIFSSWTRLWTGGAANTASIYRQQTVNITVADKDGTLIDNVTVLCGDKDDNTIFSELTGATDTGKIDEQTISYQRFYYDAGDQSHTYSPHKFTLSKAGYKTLVKENITVDGPINWDLELQSITMPPSPFFGDLKADDYYYAEVVNE